MIFRGIGIRHKYCGAPYGCKLCYGHSARESARKRLGLPEGFTVLSFGGSLGANRITEAVAELIAWEGKKGGINHIHSYGGKGKELFYGALESSGAAEFVAIPG